MKSRYFYDSNSNRINHEINSVGMVSDAIYDVQDRLVSYGTKSFTYNNNGDVSTIYDSSTLNTINLNYDIFGNLKGYISPTKNILYRVDVGNRRFSKQVGSTTVRNYLWGESNQLKASVDPSNPTSAQYFIYGSKSHVPDYMEVGVNKYQIITDHLGSPVVVVNTATGVVAQEVKYDEFGNIISDTNPGFTPFGFAGCLYDQDTKLCRFGARDYDASIGRWLSKDPILFAGGDTNLYGYVMQDPINFIDPEGTVQTKPELQGGGTGGINYIVTPGGTAYPVYGARGPTPVINPSGRVTGSAFTGAKGGVNGQVYGVRIMDPVPARGNNPGSPAGYIRYFNSQSSPQGVDPYSGKTLPNSCGHYNID